MASPSEELPLGLMVPPVEHGVEIPPEPPDVGARALSVAARLLCGATIGRSLEGLGRVVSQEHDAVDGEHDGESLEGRHLVPPSLDAATLNDPCYATAIPACRNGKLVRSAPAAAKLD